MSIDMTQSIEPRSDQVNSDDLIAGPITYTIREVVQGKAEAPFDFLLVETQRAYRPSKTMRRVIVNAWGPDAGTYAGRRVTIYREPSIMFGGQKVGGIRISHLSGIDKPAEVMVQTSRGKREKFVVQPLPDAPQQPAEPSEADVAACTDVDALKGMWRAAGPERRQQIEARVAELNRADDTTDAEVVEEGQS